MGRSSVARAFQASIYVLTVLAALLAAVGEGAWFPGVATIPVAIAAYVLNERRGTLRLPLLWINILAGTAFLATAVEFFQGEVELRMLSVMHLLMYLTWIVMFVHRPPRHYWWLCGLGVTQVAFGAVLTNSGWFGLLLVLYVPAGLWTLCLFTLYQGELQAEPSVNLTSRSSVRPAIHFDGRQSWLTLRFAMNVGLLIISGVFLGGAMFLFVPRVWAEGSSSFRGGGEETVTGFSEEVQLGEIGEILNNSRRVLQVKFFDNDTDKPLSVEEVAKAWGEEEPLFRGMVLDTYFDGRWTGPGNSRPRHLTQRFARGMIRQEYIQEEIGSQVLFGMRPFVAGKMRQGRPPMEINPENWTLTSPRTSRGGAQEYFVYSYNPENVSHDTLGKDLPKLNFRFAQRYSFVPLGLDRLGQISASVTSPDALQKFRGSSQKKVALALVDYLRDSGEFGYSLKMQVHDVGVDPIEDFLVNRREGHCEYFASALALLLRVRGIPSRVVTGFKGGRLNELTNSWEVQQRHAHSWVEAYLDEQWVTLDAVPSGRLRSLSQFDRTPQTWQNVKSLTSAVWDKYVMRLDGNVQQEWFYDPLQRKIGRSFESLRFRQSREARKALFGLFDSPREWLSWSGAFVAVFLFLVGWALYRFARKLPAWIKRLMQWAGVATDQRHVRIDFYERFRGLAESRGLRRRPGQTQREFVEEIQKLWTRSTAASGFRGIPTQLPDSFYLERFGEERLPPEDRAALNSALDILERWLKEHPRPRFGNGLAEGAGAP